MRLKLYLIRSQWLFCGVFDSAVARSQRPNNFFLLPPCCSSSPHCFQPSCWVERPRLVRDNLYHLARTNQSTIHIRRVLLVVLTTFNSNLFTTEVSARKPLEVSTLKPTLPSSTPTLHSLIQHPKTQFLLRHPPSHHTTLHLSTFDSSWRWKSIAVSSTSA